MYIKNSTDSALTLTSDKVSVNLAPGKVAYVSDEDAKANVFQRMLSRGAITQVEDEYGRTAVKDDEDRMTAQREGSKAVVSKRKGIDENQIMLVPCGYTDRNGRACGCNVQVRMGALDDSRPYFCSRHQNEDPKDYERVNGRWHKRMSATL